MSCSSSSSRCKIIATAVSETTAHGLSRTGAGRFWLARLLWAIIFTVFVVYFLIQMFASVAKVASKPVSTSVDQNSEPFQFPVVHVCIDPMISPSFTATMSPTQKQYIHNKTAELVAILKSINKNNQTSVYAISKALMGSLNNTVLFDWMGQRMEQNVVGLSVIPGDTNINISTEVTRIYHHKYGSCFSIKPNKSHVKSLLNNGIGHMDIILYLDATYKTIMTLNAGTIDVRGLRFGEYEPLLSAGVKLFFTGDNIYPDDYSPSVQLSPGFQHHILLSMTKLQLSVGKGQCINAADTVDYWNMRTGGPIPYNYTLSSCYAQKIYESYAQLNCYIQGITPILYKYRHITSCLNYSSNTTPPEPPSSEAMGQVIDQMTACLSRKPCTDQVYNPKLSSVLFPLDISSPELINLFKKLTALREAQNYSVPGRKWLSDLHDSVNGSAEAAEQLNKAVTQNLVRIKIQSSEATSTKYVQAISFTMADLLANIGGLMGLFMGCSVLTIMEIIELICCLIVGRHSTWNSKDLKVNDIDLSK